MASPSRITGPDDGRLPGAGHHRVPLPVEGEPAGTGPGVRAGERGPGVRLRVLGGLAEPDAHLHGDAQFAAGALGERRDAEAVGGGGQRPAGRGHQEAVLPRRADGGLDPLRLLHQQPVHGEPQFLTRLPGGRAPRRLPERGHLDHGDRQL